MSQNLAMLECAERVTPAAERDLRAEVLDATGSLILVFDRERRIVYCNRACAVALGRAAQEVTGRTCEEVLPPEAVSSLHRALDSLEAGRGDCPFDAPLTAPDGACSVFAWFTAVARDSAGEVEYFVGTGVEITEQSIGGLTSTVVERALREANRRLRQADRHKNEFIAVLSHELRNPLASVRNCSHILEHAEPGGEPARRALQVLSRQVTHLSSLIEDLLDLTRIAQGKIRLRRQPVELNEVVRATAEDLRAVFEQSGVTLASDITDEPLRVDADATRIAQVVSNLLQNSAKFTPAGGRAELSLRRSEDGKGAVIEVRDSGAGIEPALIGRVFEAFVQADKALDRNPGGLGLGLALVKQLVELHEGRVWAASEGRDKGALLTVWLPLDFPPASNVVRVRSQRFDAPVARASQVRAGA